MLFPGHIQRTAGQAGRIEHEKLKASSRFKPCEPLLRSLPAHALLIAPGGSPEAEARGRNCLARRNESNKVYFCSPIPVRVGFNIFFWKDNNWDRARVYIFLPSNLTGQPAKVQRMKVIFWIIEPHIGHILATDKARYIITL